MQNKKRFALSQSKGFTIIELIVVIAIIAILASVVMVSVTQYIDKSRKAAMFAELKQLHVLATQYLDETGGYAGFHAYPGLAALNSAVSKIDSRYMIGENDETGHTTPTSYQDTTHSNCTGKWVAILRLTAGGYIYCADSTGYIAEDSAYNWSNCSCN